MPLSPIRCLLATWSCVLAPRGRPSSNLILEQLLGAEGVAENGGLISGVGSFQMALAAKAFDKPVYGLAESCVCLLLPFRYHRLQGKHSYKFLRLYPLSQLDLPTATRPLTATSLPPCSKVDLARPPSRPMRDEPIPKALEMTQEMLEDQVRALFASLRACDADQDVQPILDYVLPDLVRAVISDLAVLTPSGVSDTLLAVFGGE